MTNFLAVDWDGVELRAILAASQRGSIKVLKAESATIEPGESTDQSQLPGIAQTLKNLIKREKFPRAQLLLGLNRASVDMMMFVLPKSKPEELPDLVKNQALRDSPGFSETSPIDFISGTASDGENIRAIAATISRLQLKAFRQIGQSVGMRAKRIEFRPLALAELYLRSNHAVDEPVLLVQCTADEVDMVVVESSNVVFVRSIKLPESLEKEERNHRITAEIMRTVAVSRQEIEGSALEKVIIFGTLDVHQPLQEQLREQEIEIIVQDPFRLPCVQVSAKTKVTDNPGHYAALLGMVLSEQSKSPTRIDFLHPREKPQPLNIARFVVLFLLFAGVVGYAAWYANRQYLKRLESRQAELAANIEELQGEYQQSLPTFTQLWQANQWENQQLIWLDELRDISVRLPDEQDIVITQMQYSYVMPSQYNQGNYGHIDLRGRARDVNVLQQVVRSFNSDGYHRAQIIGQAPSQSGGGYTVGFSLRIMTRRQPYSAFLQRLSPELQQLSNVAPNFPKDEPPQNDAQQNVLSQEENVTTVQNGNTPRQQTPPVVEQTPQEKPSLPHRFPPQYEPKPQQEQKPELPTNDANGNSAVIAAQPTAASTATTPTEVPPKPLQPHVLAHGYAPLSIRDVPTNTSAETPENNDQNPLASQARQHLYPGGYLPKDALQTPSENTKNESDVKTEADTQIEADPQNNGEVPTEVDTQAETATEGGDT